MRDDYSGDELADQCQRDLAEGESFHIEFKEYDYAQLAMPKKADEWKNDLSDELAALASTGGKIYIGISDGGTVKGISGTHQEWQEKLIERAVGRIKPKVSWRSYYFTDQTTGLNLIRVDVIEDEPIYYVQGKPYLRDGTNSRPAEPEEVKARFRDYFTNREPLLPSATERPEDANSEQSAVVSWVTDVLITILSSLNLYEDKHVDPQLSGLQSELDFSRQAIENNLNTVKRTLGETSTYYQGLESIANEMLAATRVQFFIDGGKSWAEWLSHLKSIHDTASNLLDTLRSTVSIVMTDLDEQEEDARDKTLRWLNSVDEFRLSKFTYEANGYVQLLLRLHFVLWLSNDEQKASRYKAIADEIERLSWARDNVHYQEILQAIPELRQKLST